MGLNPLSKPVAKWADPSRNPLALYGLKKKKKKKKKKNGGGQINEKIKKHNQLICSKTPDPIKWADHIGPAQYSDPFEFCENKEK
jgi:hypothetical protein